MASASRAKPANERKADRIVDSPKNCLPSRPPIHFRASGFQAHPPFGRAIIDRSEAWLVRFREKFSGCATGGSRRQSSGSEVGIYPLPTVLIGGEKIWPVLIIKAVRHLVTDDSAHAAVVDDVVSVRIEEWRLEDPGRENNLLAYHGIGGPFRCCRLGCP
jgi:hypothetical protein